jgi:hypothetical protein
MTPEDLAHEIIEDCDPEMHGYDALRARIAQEIRGALETQREHDARIAERFGWSGSTEWDTACARIAAQIRTGLLPAL